MKSKGMKLGAVLAVMLIVSMAFVSTVSAEGDQVVTEEEKRQLEKFQKDSKKEMKDSIRKSLEKSKNQILDNNPEMSINAFTEVPKGTDTTFSTTDWGNKDNSGWGTASSDADYYTSERKAEATSRATLGAGQSWGWAQIGKEFSVSGTGGQQADITINGWQKTLTLVGGAAASEMTVNAILFDTTSNNIKSTRQIYHWSGTAFPGGETKDQTFSSTQNVYLESGHNYIMYIQVETSASSLVYGEGASDALTDRDLPSFGQYKGYLRIDSINIDFK